MTATVVNLRRVRKATARAADAAQAAANRARHRRTAAERKADAADEARREALLDGAKRPD